MQHPEKIIQGRIQGALKALGYISIHIPNRGLYNPFTKRYNIKGDAYFLPGVPDLVVLLPEAKVLWVEVKSATGTRSSAQIRIAQMLEERGHYYALARSVADVMEWLWAHGYKHGEIA